MPWKFLIGGVVVGAVLGYARVAMGRNMAAQS